MDVALLYNTGDQPVVIDARGHTLGGGEHGIAYAGAPEVRALLDAGQLLPLANTDTPAPDERNDVTELRRLRARIEVRRARFARRGRADLRRLAERHGIPSDQTDANLAAALAIELAVDEPEDEPAKASPRDTDQEA